MFVAVFEKITILSEKEPNFSTNEIEISFLKKNAIFLVNDYVREELTKKFLN